MFGKLIRLFSSDTSNKEVTKKAKSNITRKNNTIDPSRIGGLGEYKIDIQLSQLPKPSKYLNDIMLANPESKTGYSQIDHLLVTAYGIFVIETKNYSGTIKGGKWDKQWRVNGKFPMNNPLRQNYGHIQALKNVLNGYTSLKFISIITFTKRCELRIDPDLREITSDELVIYDIKLTEMIQRKLIRLKMESNTHTLNESTIQHIVQLLTAANITDPLKRAEHINKAIPKK